jgi:thymidylate synthase
MTSIQPPFFNSFDHAYKTILGEVFHRGSVSRPRGLEIRELTNVTFTAPALACRLDFESTQAYKRQITWESYHRKELDWYLSGNDDAQSAPSKFWHSLANDSGKINSNYGKMILHDKKYPGNLTAFESAVDILTKDPDSRQAILFYSSPSYYTDGCKDVPCTIAAHLLLRGGILYMSVFQRSCDAILGIVYDFPWSAFLLEKIAGRLGVAPGNITHFSGSLHVYEQNFDLARSILTPRDVSA